MHKKLENISNLRFIDSIGDLKLRIRQAEQAEAYRNLRGSAKDPFYETSF